MQTLTNLVINELFLFLFFVFNCWLVLLLALSQKFTILQWKHFFWTVYTEVLLNRNFINLNYKLLLDWLYNINFTINMLSDLTKSTIGQFDVIGRRLELINDFCKHTMFFSFSKVSWSVVFEKNASLVFETWIRIA